MLFAWDEKSCGFPESWAYGAPLVSAAREGDVHLLKTGIFAGFTVNMEVLRADSHEMVPYTQQFFLLWVPEPEAMPYARSTAFCTVKSS